MTYRRLLPLLLRSDLLKCHTASDQYYQPKRYRHRNPTPYPAHRKGSQPIQLAFQTRSRFRHLSIDLTITTNFSKLDGLRYYSFC